MIMIFQVSLWILAGLMALGLPVAFGSVVGARFGKPLWTSWQTQRWCRWLYAVFVIAAIAFLEWPRAGVAANAGQFVLAELLLMSSVAFAVGRWVGKRETATGLSPDNRWHSTLPLMLVPMLGLNLYVSTRNYHLMIFRAISLGTMLGLVTGLTWIGVGI